MKVKGTNGEIYTWSLGQYVGTQNNNASALHERMRDFLEENFPALHILEEVYIPSEKLYLDFVLPLKKIAVECQGEQHQYFVPFFHGNKTGYQRAKARDMRKQEFCRINGIHLIYVYEDDEEEKWKKIFKID